MNMSNGNVDPSMASPRLKLPTLQKGQTIKFDDDQLMDYSIKREKSRSMIRK